MTNAKTEFLEHIRDKPPILCARVIFGDPWYIDEESKFINLKMSYTQSDLENFLCSIDKEYDLGYGDQELFGTIWYTNGTWSSRGDYDDGGEWWEHNTVPKIPDGLLT